MIAGLIMLWEREGGLRKFDHSERGGFSFRNTSRPSQTLGTTEKRRESLTGYWENEGT